MRIHLLAVLFLVLFSTSDSFAQTSPNPQSYFPQSQPGWIEGTDWYIDWLNATYTHTQHFKDWYLSSQAWESPDKILVGLWIHYEEEDTATEQIYRIFNMQRGPASQTPHVIDIYEGHRAYDNGKKDYGSWAVENNTLKVTVQSAKYEFRTDRLDEGILVRVNK